jgi:two-component system OmpR family sensor kinase
MIQGMRRRTISTWLAGWIAAATTASIAVYAATAALVFWADETYEDEDEGRGDGEPEGFDAEDAAELVTELTLALIVAAPVGILFSALGARWLTHRAIHRIDDVIATAARMSADDLGARLPVSGRGDELDDLAGALNALFARIDAGIAAQRQFAADASHELRSPLTVLASTLEIARRRPRSPAEWETFADRALDEVRHLNAVVDGLLQFARAGQIRRTRQDLAALVDAVHSRWSSIAADAGIHLELDVPDEVTADVDADLVSVALANLVANAIAYTPAGGTIHLRLEPADDVLRLHVDDTGPGVAPDERARILEPFVRSAAPAADRADSRAGVGLGLAIVRRVAEAHGGAVTIADAPTGGARFTLGLPVA